jgi:hypothetical protein
MKTFGERLLARMLAVPQARNHRETNHRSRIEEERDGVRVFVEFDDVDKIGMRMRQLYAENAKPFVDAELDTGRLRRQADEIVRRVTYLTEQIELIELDQHNGKAQLRSKHPQREKERTSFFEILFDGNHKLSLRRYESSGKALASRRVGIAFELTHDIFNRLVSDLVAVLAIDRY